MSETEVEPIGCDTRRMEANHNLVRSRAGTS